MTDKTDNPEMIKVYKRLSMLLRRLEYMMGDAEELKSEIEYAYDEINHIYNRIESIEYHSSQGMPKHVLSFKKEDGNR